MVFYKLKLGEYETLYKFPTKKTSSDYLPCDMQGNVLERINETKQRETKIQQVNQSVISLDMKKQRGTITPEEEQQLEKLRNELSVRQEIENMKAYFISETGEVHQKASKLVDGEPMESFKGRTDKVTSEEYKFCEINEYSQKEYEGLEKGFMISKDWYKILKDKNQALKYNAHYGNGWNEVRTYIYPSRVDDILVVIKITNKEQLYERLDTELSELRTIQEMKALLEQAKLQTNEINKGRIAGNLDD